MVAGPHACSDWIFSGHDGNPNIPRDHHVHVVSVSTPSALSTRMSKSRALTDDFFFPFLCSDLGYEEGLSTLGMVSGLFGAFWCLG